jgi:hypothetical protein
MSNPGANDMQIRIINLVGDEMNDVHIGPMDNESDMDISLTGLIPGIYFVEIKNADRIWVEKITVE